MSSTRPSSIDAKRSEALTKSCHKSVKQHCTQQLLIKNSILVMYILFKKRTEVDQNEYMVACYEFTNKNLFLCW